MLAGAEKLCTFNFICLPSHLTLSHLTTTNRIKNMSNIASTSLRQASRLCLRQASSTGLNGTAPLARVLPSCAQKISRRSYVSETKKDNAQVNVETAIRADQKAFFAETGKLPENQPTQGTTVNADAMMSPMAGKFAYRS